MSHQAGNYFHHRHNGNGTHDSVCGGCYVTVASAGNESELATFEKAHLCDPVLAYQVSQYGHRAIAAAALDRRDGPRSVSRY